MFGWFRKKEAPLIFDSNVAAFEHAWSEMNYAARLEAVIPALVLEQGENGAEGEHYFLLRLAVREGINELWGCTLKEAKEYPEPGDLVGFRVVRIASDLPPEASFVGYIAYKLDPVLVGKGWKIAKNFTPPNIRPTVRF